MVSKIESFIQYMFAYLVIVLLIGIWIMLIWMLSLPATLSFVKEENYFFIPLLLGLIILLPGIILFWLISRHNFSIPIKFAFYITIYLTIYLAAGCFLYSLVVVEVLSDTSFATIYVGFITITTIVASIIKYWDSKQLKWTFSIIYTDGIYIKRCTNNIIISENVNKIKVSAQSNKNNSKLAFAGYCSNHDIHKVAGKRKDYLGRIYNPDCKYFLNEYSVNYNALSNLRYHESKKEEQNRIEFEIPCPSMELATKLYSHNKKKGKIWLIFFDDHGEIWGIKTVIHFKHPIYRVISNCNIKGISLVYNTETNYEYWKTIFGNLIPRYTKEEQILSNDFSNMGNNWQVESNSEIRWTRFIYDSKTGVEYWNIFHFILIPHRKENDRLYVKSPNQ